VRLRDVDEAQGKIVTLTKELSDKGEVVIADEGGSDELVY
jgi:flagellar motor switch protein FliG